MRKKAGEKVARLKTDHRKNGHSTPRSINRAARMNKVTEDERLLISSSKPEIPFTETDPWRVFRIMGEFVDGFDTLATLGPAVTIFGSARVSEDDPMYQSAMEVARLLGEAGFNIITGGGPGIMEAGNRGARLAKVKSVGLNIELPFEQGINHFVDIPIEFRHFFIRKTMFVKYAEAFIIFPGGFGTMDELFESLTLIQTGKIHNFPVILFGRKYWSGLIKWMRSTMHAEGKICAADLDLLILTDSPKRVCEVVLEYSRGESTRREKEEEAVQGTKDVLGK